MDKIKRGKYLVYKFGTDYRVGRSEFKAKLKHQFDCETIVCPELSYICKAPSLIEVLQEQRFIGGIISEEVSEDAIYIPCAWTLRKHFPVLRDFQCVNLSGELLQKFRVGDEFDYSNDVEDPRLLDFEMSSEVCDVCGMSVTYCMC